MKYLKYVKISLAVVLVALVAVMAAYAGFSKGREYGETAVWSYCYSNGGILTNPNLPGAAIGCMAIENSVAKEPQNKDWPSDKT